MNLSTPAAVILALIAVCTVLLLLMVAPEGVAIESAWPSIAVAPASLSEPSSPVREPPRGHWGAGQRNLKPAPLCGTASREARWLSPLGAASRVKPAVAAYLRAAAPNHAGRRLTWSTPAHSTAHRSA